MVNRAPLLTIWAMIVAERLGFEREEALSIGRFWPTLHMIDCHQSDISPTAAGSVYTEMNAVAKGLSPGIIDQSRKTEIEPISGEQQPYVDLMGRR